MSFLRGIRVLDMCYGLAGPLATQVLADYEAEIVRVDLPGTQARRPDELVRLRGRRSIVIDPGVDPGRRLIARLIDASDVLITEPPLAGTHLLGSDYAALARTNSRLVWCRITGYGDEGPLARHWAHDHLVAARYGVYNQPGWRPGPTFLTAPVPSLGAGLLAVQAIGTALLQREITGKGQEVTTSLLAGALALQPGISSASLAPPPRPLPIPSPLGMAPFYSLYECADGRWLHFGCLSAAFQQHALDALGLREQLTALGFGTPAAAENLQAILARVRARMREKPFEEWAKLLEDHDVPYALSQWTEDLLDDAQVRHEGLVVEIDDPTVGPMLQMGSTVEIEGVTWPRPLPAPVPGAHSGEVCRELGLGGEEIAALRREGAIA
jgi:crotonobetainyl-CoA:carnitine CoA-transferase CaiB-like acyl-CoA transferase